ncbi:MAG: S8 family serine peptidase, partial [Phycisphaerae bacterium]
MMVKVDRRRTAGFIVVIVGMLAAQGVTLGANGGQEFVYYYFDQPVGLTLDLDRVAIEELTDGPRRLVRSTPDVLLDVGIPAEALERTQVPGMAKVLVPAQINSEAGIRKLVADLVNTNAFAFVSPVFVDQAGDPVIIRREIFVGFGEAADPVQSQATLMASVTGRIVEANYADMPGVYRVEPDSQNGFDVLALANTLAQRPDVVFAEPDAFRAVHRSFIPNDPFFSQQWDKHNTGGGGGVADVDMNGPEAWDISFGDPAIVVAVLDDGVQQNHPDLNQIGGTDTTGNGTGGDPLNSCDNHGTTVAGCVGAIIDNGVALAGIAPGCKVAGVKWNVSNTPCDGGGTFAISWFVNALTWAQNNADVTNNSNGFGSSSTITNKYDSTRAAGLIHFASSGNGGTGTIGYPSSIGSVNSIGSITRSGARSSFSNWGNGIAFAAPGSAIITTDRTGSDGFVFGDAISANGTSYSSPNAS